VYTARLNPEMSGLAFILEYVWRRAGWTVGDSGLIVTVTELNFVLS
jgi:hypothetical protein